MWKMLDCDFPWSIDGDAGEQHELRLKRWPSITLSGQITDELVQQALRLGGSQHDKKEEIPWASSYRGTLNWRCGARKIDREGLEEGEKEGESSKGKVRVIYYIHSSPPSAFYSVNSSEIQRKHSEVARMHIGWVQHSCRAYSNNIFIHALIDFMWFWML